MYLLEAAITLDVDKLPFEHLVIILSFLLVFISVVFINGFSIRLGDKECNIGGVMRLLAKKDEDISLKESLKKFSDDIDHEIEADLYDLIEDVDTRVDRMLVDNHCYFTMDKFSSLVKKELQKRVRRNNLRERLSELGRAKYTAKILKDVEKQYQFFQVKTVSTGCKDQYGDFSTIKDFVQAELNTFFFFFFEILVAGMV
jgi:hypothetical protein